jgi:hypothetical protein
VTRWIATAVWRGPSRIVVVEHGCICARQSPTSAQHGLLSRLDPRECCTSLRATHNHIQVDADQQLQELAGSEIRHIPGHTYSAAPPWQRCFVEPIEFVLVAFRQPPMPIVRFVVPRLPIQHNVTAIVVQAIKPMLAMVCLPCASRKRR